MTRKLRIGDRIPLSLRLPALAALLMILLGALASQQVLTTLKRVQNERIRELARIQMEALSVAVGPHVLRNNIWEIYDTLDRAKAGAGATRAAFIAVADSAGRVLAASDPRRAPVDTPIGDIAARAVNLADLNVAAWGKEVLVKEPLIYQGRRVGTIFAEFDVSDLLDERRRISRLLLLWNGAATGFLALVGYFAMQRMLAPVTRLARHIGRSTDAPEPIPDADMPQGDTEIARLARTYNHMVEAMQAKAETERRLAERERLVSLGRLSATLAHEINNPLGGLLNVADTIREYADRPEVVRQSSDLIGRGLRHLRDVARATLDQHRIDRTGQPASLGDLDDIRLLIEPEIRHQEQYLAWEIDAGAETLSAFPAASLRQIILNLLLNAASAAGHRGEIGLRLQEVENGLKIVVSDTGPGLSREARKRLISGGPVTPGGGVGFRVVHDLVKELNGKVNVIRRDGRSLIEVDMPIGERGII